MTDGPAADLEIHVIAGGAPTPAEEAALTIAVSRAIAARDKVRASRAPLWGTVGRIEAQDGTTIRSRAVLMGHLTRATDTHGLHR